MFFKYIFLAVLKHPDDRMERYCLNLFEMSSLDEILKDNAAFSVQKLRYIYELPTISPTSTNT
jgi:hypothetical protein